MLKRVQLKAVYNRMLNKVFITYKGKAVMGVQLGREHTGINIDKLCKMVLEENRKIARDIVLDHYNN